MEIINIEARTFEAMTERFKQLVQKVNSLCCPQNRELGKWLDNQEVCVTLNISKRTLQTYRDNGTLPYSQINHKMYYKPEDIERVLNQQKTNRMNNNLITKDHEAVKSFFLSLEQMLDGIENIVENCKPSLNVERYLTDKEVSEQLKLSRRTLQDYRTEGKIPYYQLGGGKILYRESGIEKMLNDNYFTPFE